MAKPPDGRGSAAMEARRTKFKDGFVEELPGAPADTRAQVGRRESPHAAACRAIEAARRDNAASDPMPTLAATGPATCTACGGRKVPIGHAGGTGYCADGCYAYRWSPTPPTPAAFVPLLAEAGKP